MKKKIEINQDKLKEIDFTKIKNVNYVDANKDRMIIEFEMKEEEIGKEDN